MSTPLELKETKEKDMSDNYNVPDPEYYGNRILPRTHWDGDRSSTSYGSGGVHVHVPYDPNEFLPNGVADASGRKNLNDEYQRKRVEEEEKMKKDLTK